MTKTFEKNNTILVNTKYDIPPFEIVPNKYRSTNELNLAIYNTLPENAKFKTGKAQLQKNLYTGFQRLFNKSATSYLGWTIKQEETQAPSFKVLSNLSTSNINVTKSFETIIFEHFQEFYMTYMPTKLNKWNGFFNLNFKTSPSLVSDQVKLNEWLIFQTFRSKREFDNYLKNSCSCYHKLCYWLSQNSINFEWISNNSVYCEEHHVFPTYMKNNHKIPGNINISFNIIKIPWFTHMLLHALRYIEFGYQEDKKTIRITYGKLCSTLNIENDDFLKEQYKKLGNLFSYVKNCMSNKKIQKTIFDIETNQNTSLLNSNEIKNATVKKIYENPMIWQNNLYPSIPDVSIPANKIRAHKDLVPILKNRLEKYFEQNPQVQKPLYWDSWSTRKLGNLLGIYLRQFDESNHTKKSTAFFGWSLLEFHDQIKEWQTNHFIHKSRLAGTKKNLDVLDSGRYQWVNRKHKKRLVVKAKKYPALPYLAYDLMKMLPVKNRPAYWENSLQHNGKSVHFFSNVINQKQNSYMGWELEEIVKTN